jgi:bla regulator protein blaR1
MTGQANFLQSLGWAVLNSLWQLALLWVIYQLITGVYRDLRSSTRSSLSSALLIGGFGWFIYTFFATYYDKADQAIISASFVNAQGNYQLNEWLGKTLPIASVVYLVLLVLPLLHFIRNYRYVQVIRHYGLSRINVEWRLFVNRVAKQMNIRKKVQIWISEFVSSPVTVGFLKPVILVPLAAVNHLTPQQLEAVILHELSHIRRFDYLVNLVINLIQAVLYFNPFAKAFVRIVEKEREKSCDEMVLQFQYDSHEYASALLTLEKANRNSKALAIAASGKKNDLLNRIELIMGVRRKALVSFSKLGGLMAGLLCIIGLNAFLLLSKSAEEKKRITTATTPSISTFDFITESRSPAPLEKEFSTVEDEIPFTITNSVDQDDETQGSTPSNLAEYAIAATDPDYINVSLGPEMAKEVPELKKYQEEEVERALAASKKVLESVQWKAVEKNIADAFDQQEKEALKKTYQKEIAKVDWNKLENKLKMAYDKIDWETINSQLATAVTQVRLDSIQRVYNQAISKLDVITKELTRNELKGIPDTDISLHDLEARRADMQKALNDLRKLRSKKIVHL